MSAQPKDKGQIPQKRSAGELIAKGINYYILICGVLIVGLFIIGSILMYAGVIKTDPTPSYTIPITPKDPNAFRTAIPKTQTPLPTPTAKPIPHFSRGDIVAYEPVTSDTDNLYIILDYDSKNDGYDTTFIYRNDDGSWGHWTWQSNDYFFEREKFEKNYGKPDTWIYGHIDPDQVHCEQPKDPDAAKFFICTRN